MDAAPIPSEHTHAVAKMHGAGNDFCVLAGAPRPEVVRAMADRRTGIGADGVLFLERLEDPGALRMHFFNADGGRAGLCLNGSRCVALRALQWGWADGDHVRIHTDHQVVEATVQLAASGREGRVSLEIQPPRSAATWIDLPAASPAARGARVNTGDPHLVVEANTEGDFVAAARALRHDPCVGPEGANVHFVDRSAVPWRIRSFERGVEDETLACGSGCVSAVAALAEGPTALRTSRGDVIEVDPTGDLWRLEGPAVLVFETEWRA